MPTEPIKRWLVFSLRIVTDLSKLDAKSAIVGDLSALQSERRRHFAPAWLIAILLVGTLVTIGARPDLLDQPPWQLGLQALLWVFCLLLFPAIGLGLWFPGATTRLALVLAGITATVMATTGYPFVDHGAHEAWGGLDQCVGMVVGSGVILVALGFLSGAFVQRRRVTAVYWVAAGLALAALNVVTWVCPVSGLNHVLPSHVGGAMILLAMAVVVGVVARRTAAEP